MVINLIFHHVVLKFDSQFLTHLLGIHTFNESEKSKEGIPNCQFKPFLMKIISDIFFQNMITIEIQPQKYDLYPRKNLRHRT